MDDPQKQHARDLYYMHVATAVETGADCLGTSVGAVLVLDNRVISTGYNGTPASFPNCSEGGCIRCHDSWLLKQGREDEMTDPAHISGAALDRCICVHGEQNAFITAARFGIRVEGSTLYTTQSPCLNYLKEAVRLVSIGSCIRPGIRPNTVSRSARYTVNLRIISQRAIRRGLKRWVEHGTFHVHQVNPTPTKTQNRMRTLFSHLALKMMTIFSRALARQPTPQQLRPRPRPTRVGRRAS